MMRYLIILARMSGPRTVSRGGRARAGPSRMKTLGRAHRGDGRPNGRIGLVTIPIAVGALVAAGRLQAVPADRLTARRRVARAGEMLDAARKIAAIDVAIAYATAYDAMRIAVTAHMLGLGYRDITAGPGTIAIYARAVLSSPSVDEYERIARRRDESEYDASIIGRADLTADLAHAAAIIQAVRAAL